MNAASDGRAPATLAELLRRVANEHAQRPALTSARGDQGEPCTYAELLARAVAGAQRLRSEGVSRGESVVLLAEGRPEWTIALFAIAEAGAAVVPLPADTPPAAVATAARLTQARAIVTSERSSASAQAAQPTPVLSLSVLTAPRAAHEPATAQSAGAQPTPSADDIAVIAFTSGSTEHPHAVELTHANLLADLAALRAVRSAGPGDAFLSMLPPAHLFELTAGQLGPLSCGARIVFSGAPLPNRLIDALRDERITHAMTVPALLDALYHEVLDELATAGLVDPERRGQTPAETARRMADETDAAHRARVREGVRRRIGETFGLFVVGGAAIDPAWSGVVRPLGIRLEVGYGLTEAAPVVTLGVAGECPTGSVGAPLPGIEVRIAEGGEILVRGPNVMRGYHRDAEATRRALRDGWLATGDHGHLDAEGFLFIDGRLKEAMVTAAGETIYPEEIEACYGDAAFRELCVAGVPGPHGNDLPTLFVVPDEERRGDVAATAQRLRASAPARLRVADVVTRREPLPRTASGKVRRAALVAQWIAEARRQDNQDEGT